MRLVGIALAIVLLVPGSAPAQGQHRARRLTDAEFRAGVESGAIRVEIPSVYAEQVAARRSLMEDYQTAVLLLRDDPERLQTLLPPPEAQPGVLDRLPNGDFLLHRATGEEFVLLGEGFKWGSLANGLANAASYPNQNRILTEFHRMLSPDFMHQYPLPTSDLGLAELREDNLDIGRTLVIAWAPPPVNPFDPPTVDCNKEYGQANGSDGAFGTQKRPQFLGVDWSLRPYTTCVKNQGRRGTCVSFGVTAAVEAAHLVLKGGTKQNLSEQAFYDAAYRHWGLGDWRKDGLVTQDALDRATGKAYRFGIELIWPYNPSYSGTALVPSQLVFLANERPGSCANYTSYCSNFLHQAIPVTGEKGLLGFLSPAGAGNGPRILSWVGLDTNPSGQTMAKAYLTLNVPVVLSLEVDTQFDAGGGLDQPGVVDWLPDTKNMGGHAVMAVGFIENAWLPGGKPAGQGGGYFVVKNSWGTGWGDNGYGYLSYEWVRRHGLGMQALTNVD